MAISLKNSKWYRRFIFAALSILYTGFSMVGFYYSHYGEAPAAAFVRYAPVIAIALALIFYFMCVGLCSVGQAEKGTAKPDFRLSGRLFFLALLINYTVYALLSYPGSVTYDTFVQIQQHLGDHVRSNANPYAVTVFFGLLYSLGALIGTPNTGVFLGCFVQAVLMAWAFSKLSVRVGRVYSSKAAAAAVFAFFLILPLWGGAAQQLSKDSLHVSLFVLFFLRFTEMFEKGHSLKDYLVFGLWMLIAAVSRAASVYIVFVCAVVLVLYHRRGERMRHILLTAAFCLAVFLYNNALLPAFGIEEAPERENYSLQFRQVALVCRERGYELSQEDIDIINDVLDFEYIQEMYDPDLADYIKLSYHGNDESLRRFNELYFRLMLKYPLIYVKSLAQCSWMYFYPPSPGANYFTWLIWENEYGIYRQGSPVEQTTLKWCSFWAETPVLRLFIGGGLYIWLTLFAFAKALSDKNKRLILTVLPMLVFTIGMVLTPLNGENRYAYPIIAISPLLLAMCLCRAGNSAGTC